jgi:hypothetical protein
MVHRKMPAFSPETIPKVIAVNATLLFVIVLKPFVKIIVYKTKLR